MGGFLNREDAKLPGDLPAVPTPPDARTDEERTPLPDPFAYDPERRKEFELRAAAGASHVLYARSPGGAGATAQRVAQFRPQIEAAAKAAGVDPDRLEALVFLESAGPLRRDRERHRGRGRPDPDPRRDGPEPARHEDRRRQEPPLLPAHPPRAAARAHPQGPQAPARPRAGRPALRPRAGADGHRALPEAGQGPLRARGPRVRLLPHGHGQPDQRPAAPTGSDDVPYTQVYFDSTPARHTRAYAKLASFGDDSSNYWWKLAAAERIMELSRHDAGKLAALQAAQTAKASAEEVLHPPGSTERFTTPEQLQAAWKDEKLVAFPRDERVTGPARRPADGRARPAPRAAAHALRGPAAGGARHRALHRRAGARAVGPVAADRHLDGARRRLPAAAGEPQPRGHPRLLAAHHGLGVRHRAPLPLQAAGAGVPVRARPPAGARRDRVGARAGRDPRDRRADEGEALLPLLERIQPAG